MENKEIIERLHDAGYALVNSYEGPAGEEFSDHSHEGEQFMVILRGNMDVRIGGNGYALHTGDELVIPAKTTHSAKIGPDGCAYMIGGKEEAGE